jgi:hypothetical protein
MSGLRTGTPLRSRKKRAPALAGRDTFHVLAPDRDQLAVKGEAPHALLVAQRVAETSPNTITLTVERRSLFGPSVTIYHVTRNERGTVFTNTR